MYFSLRTENEELRKRTSQIIEELKKIFSESNIEIKEYGCFTTIETHNVSGLVDFTTTHSLSLFDDIGENSKKIKIDIDMLDVVYDLER